MQYNKGLRLVYDESHITPEELSVHCKHKHTLLMEPIKHFQRENPYFMENIFTKKKLRYNPRLSNNLPPPKMNTKWDHFYSLSFPASHLWNLQPDYKEDQM